MIGSMRFFTLALEQAARIVIVKPVERDRDLATGFVVERTLQFGDDVLRLLEIDVDGFEAVHVFHGLIEPSLGEREKPQRAVEHH